MRYIIIGPGRSGSHWISDLIVRITELPLVNDNIQSWQQAPAVLHSHDIYSILKTELPDDTLIILTQRKNIFESIISLVVARHTDEWYFYTDKEIDPFYVDPDTFFDLIHKYQEYQEFAVASFNDLGLSYKICVFEDLVAALDKYQFLADLIGYGQDIDPDKKDVPENRNNRDYKKLIINYDELQQAWKNSLG